MQKYSCSLGCDPPNKAGVFIGTTKKVHRMEMPILDLPITSTMHRLRQKKKPKPQAAQSEIGNLAGLRLRFVSDQGDEFRIGRIRKKDNPKEVPSGRIIPTLPRDCLSLIVYRWLNSVSIRSLRPRWISAAAEAC